MSTVTQGVTAGQLFRMPDDGFRYELMRGELRKMSPAGFDHGAIIMNLGVPLGHHVKTNNLGVVVGAETGFLLTSSPDTVLGPDIAFIKRERIPAEGRPKGFWPGAPDLAVEVLSPSMTKAEIEEKVREYLAAGTLAVVIVNPKRRGVTVHRPRGQAQILAERDTLDLDDVVPGFRIHIATIFA